MNVLLNEEEQMLKNLVREFLERECPTSLVRAMEEDPLGYPPDLWRQMAGLGWFGLALPVEYGGQEAPLTYLGIVLEEVGRHLAPVPFHSTVVPALTIAREGTDEQRRDILPLVGRGDMILTWAVTDKDPRYLPETVQTEAAADGDDFLIS